jgi:hypothetical protein
MLRVLGQITATAEFWVSRLLLGARNLLIRRVSPPVKSAKTGGEQEASLLKQRIVSGYHFDQL